MNMRTLGEKQNRRKENLYQSYCISTGHGQQTTEAFGKRVLEKVKETNGY